MTDEQRQIIALNRRVGLLEGCLSAWVNTVPDEAERAHMVAVSKRILEETTP
jgi:hypothetical protein